MDDYGILSNALTPNGPGQPMPTPTMPQQPNILQGILALLFPSLASSQPSPSSPQPIPSSALPQPTPVPAPQPQQYATNPFGQQYAIQPWMQESGRALQPMFDPIADVAGAMAGSMVSPTGRAVLASERGAVGKPRISVGEVQGGMGGYQPSTGRVTLDRATIRTLNPVERAEVVRHELAHKVETESGVWQDTDTYLWKEWEQHRNAPIFDYMADKTGRWKFDNNQSPEIIAHLYANDYPKGTFTAFNPEKGTAVEHPIPAPLMRILDRIENQLGIWTKKAARGTSP